MNRAQSKEKVIQKFKKLRDSLSKSSLNVYANAILRLKKNNVLDKPVAKVFEHIKKKSFICDPWHLFRESDIATLTDVTYSTLGKTINL